MSAPRTTVTVRPSPFGWVVVGVIALSFLAVAFCALAVAVAAAQGKLNHPPAAAPAAPAPALAEDDPAWDCSAMGNLRCGPGAPAPASPEVAALPCAPVWDLGLSTFACQTPAGAWVERVPATGAWVTVSAR